MVDLPFFFYHDPYIKNASKNPRVFLLGIFRVMLTNMGWLLYTWLKVSPRSMGNASCGPPGTYMHEPIWLEVNARHCLVKVGLSWPKSGVCLLDFLKRNLEDSFICSFSCELCLVWFQELVAPALLTMITVDRVMGMVICPPPGWGYSRPYPWHGLLPAL